MKIDIHVHTKKTKRGDVETRNVDAKRFAEVISGTEVKIVAITNHNVFDYVQYKSMLEEAGHDIQIWPGVELDIIENERRAHLLVIVSPTKAESLDKIISKLSVGKTPDTFAVSMEDVVASFDQLNPVYIAHYHQKRPGLLDESIEKLVSRTKYRNRVIKEVTNAISAGIYISHGHRSIFGSDVQDWNQYESEAKGLPDLRLPVESFEHFCLLLEKDTNAINTVLDKKPTETLVLRPFEDNTELNLKVYNDINILFGAKGTGKTKILEAIAKHYKDKGINADVYETGREKLDTQYDLKGKAFSIDLKKYGIDYCTDEIDLVKKATEKDVTNISSYMQFFITETKNKNAKKIKIKDYISENLQLFERKLLSVDSTFTKFSEFIGFVRSDKTLRENVSSEKIAALEESLSAVFIELGGAREKSFILKKINQMFNGLIALVKREISRKTGTPEKPATTGFQEYASNRIKIELNVSRIYENIKKIIDIPKEYVGSLGPKGDMYCKTEIVFQDGDITDGSMSSKSPNVTKSLQKQFAKDIRDIIDCVYDSHLFEKIAGLNSVEKSELIKTTYELLLFKRYFVLDDILYSPSNGEVSMLLLHKELSENKDIYILDEPEKSLGNEYINDVIVPLIKEKAKVGKRIFISTHDANIAVRTLPYNSIYRVHKVNAYDTYTGNPFSNNLVNINDQNDTLDWKNMSMKTLEGGAEAFGERGRIYGNL